MAHDPLCPLARYTQEAIFTSCATDFDCRCELIREARADTLHACTAAAQTDLLALEDDMVAALGNTDAARLVAKYRNSMPSFQPLEQALTRQP